jgi:hypothetical protein
MFTAMVTSNLIPYKTHLAPFLSCKSQIVYFVGVGVGVGAADDE